MTPFASASSAQLLAGVESGMDVEAGVVVPEIVVLEPLAEGIDGERPLAAIA